MTEVWASVYCWGAGLRSLLSRHVLYVACTSFLLGMITWSYLVGAIS